MVKYFSRQVSKKFSVASIIPPRDKETWVTLRQEEMMSQLKGHVFAVESLGVHTSDNNGWCPYIVTWSNTDLVNRRYSLDRDGTTSKVHGFADSNPKRRDWERCIDIPPFLCHNIWQFFLSDIQVEYMKLMKVVCDKKGRLVDCCPSGMSKTFYADPVKEIGPIDCYLCHGAADDGGDPVMNFLNAVMNCSHMEKIYNIFSTPYLTRLIKYDVELESSQYYNIPVYKNSYFLFPLDAVRKLLMFFQELEIHNFMYAIPEKKQTDPIIFSVCLPKSDKPTTVGADIEILIGISQSDQCCIACQEDDLTLTEIKSDIKTNPSVMAMNEMLNLENTEDAIEKNLMTSRGIGAVKKRGYVSFEVK